MASNDEILNNDNQKIYLFYINQHQELVKKYGPKTLILMMIGSFYEMYAVFDFGPDLKEISKLLNIVCTRKSKSQPESWDNPKMMGFQMNSLEKFLEVLTNNNYTVVVFDQKVKIDESAKKPKDRKKITREISGIYTKSININNLQQYNNNYLVCLYVLEEAQKKVKGLTSVGLSCVDLSTGHVFVHSSYSERYDEYIALDDASRFINNINPSEILVYCDSYDENYLYGYLGLEKDKTRFYKTIDQKYKNISFQNEYLKKIYPSADTLLSPIEQLDLEKEPNVIISLCLLFDFVYDKMPSFLKNIKYPELTFGSNHLVLGNNAVAQLDLFSDSNNNIQTKYKSLFDVVNETKTPLGERYLRNILASPHINKKKLNDVYAIIENMRQKKISNEITNLLVEIRDIERLSRKLELRIIKPYEFCMFISSYEKIIDLQKLLDKDFSAINNKENIKQILDYVSDIFNLEKLALCNFDEKVNIYNNNVHKDIDEINSKIHSGKDTMTDLARVLAKYLGGSVNSEDKVVIKNSKKEGNYIFMLKYDNLFDGLVELELSDRVIRVADLVISDTKSGCKIFAPTLERSVELFELKNKILDLLDAVNDNNNANNNSIQIKTSQTGYYLSLTANRAKTLKDELSKQKFIDLGYKKIVPTELEFTFSKNTAKILIPSLNDNADKLEEYVNKISELYKMHYNDDIAKIYSKFSKVFEACNDFVTKIDYYNSCTILSLKKGYCKPLIEEKKYSFVTAKSLRHPIVERIIDYEYVPHDISIGKDLKGMLIYGLNSSGKSVLMKSVGLCVIMAQCGMYVPAESFTFSPYHQVLTRINGNDNIFKGLSSFGIEMSEINSILKRSNENTLIIGDEICRGTEHISGNSLVAATIIKLSTLKPTFIFTTHLHEIMSLDEIKEISTVKAFHLKVNYDTKTNTLIYDRKLTDGCGEPIYGITVAKYIIQDNEFIDTATKIKNKLLNNYNTLISGKTSRYNSALYIHECNICHAKDTQLQTNLETHHINFQKDCDENDLVKTKKHIKKNDKSNLIVLCQSCHDKLHSGKLAIEKKTSKINGVGELVK